jgi:hypothetical protein
MNPQDYVPEESSDHGDLPVVSAAPLDDPYEVFGLWMNVQLSQLVAKWSHAAAPNAKRAATKDFGRRISAPRKPK